MGTTETSPDGSVSYLFTSKNLTYRHKLYRWLIIGCWVLMGYACVGVIVFIDDWGAVEVLWRFRRDGAPAPGALLLVALRVGVAATSCASGLWAGVGGVVAPLLGLGVVGCVLWLVWHISFMYQWPYIEDWHRGTVRHENVACQNFHTELSTGKRSHREYVFDLVAEDGTERNYRIRASAMKEKAEDEREPYASVYYTCKGEEDGLSIVIYEHTGIITEAWTNQAGQVH